MASVGTAVHNGLVAEPPGWPSDIESKSKLTRADVEAKFPVGSTIRVVGIKGMPPLYGGIMFHARPGQDYRILGVCCRDKRSNDRGGRGCFDLAVPVEYLQVLHRPRERSLRKGSF